ncbi:MAG: roadblock/LC7 domain-containing protein [Promethearchaeota archaeon]|jgi:predicted regulator of Ras-like GTPase activity (Roadblock/LC7/MglB family)
MNEKVNETSLEKKNVIPLLDTIKELGNFTGIIFAKRNGELIYQNIQEKIDMLGFTSMCASVLESAIGLGTNLGSQKIRKIIADFDIASVLLAEVSKEAFVIFILNENSNASFVLDKLDQTIEDLKSSN